MMTCIKYFIYEVWCKVKCKSVPLQAWTVPYGCRSLRVPEFVDSWHTKVAKVVRQGGVSCM
jgi:hypothetical protein